MNIREIEFIRNVIEISQGNKFVDKKLFELKQQKALLILNNEVERRKVNNKLSIYKVKYFKENETI